MTVDGNGTKESNRMENLVLKVNPSLVTILLCEGSVKILNVNEDFNYHNPSLGLATKAKAYKGVGQE